MVDHVGWAADLGGDPAGDDRDESRRAHHQRKAVQPAPVVEAPAGAGEKAPEAEREHEKAESDHDAERPEDDLQEWKSTRLNSSNQCATRMPPSARKQQNNKKEHTKYKI